MLKKNRLVFILITFFGLITLSVVLYYFLSPKTVMHDKLSDRALEFIDQSSGELQDANLTPKEKRINEKIIVENCFSFILPFELNTSRSQGVCNSIYNIANPMGRIVVRIREVSIDNINDLPDVKLRVDRSDEYKMTEKNINGYDYLLFEKSENGYEITGFTLKNGNILTISLTSQINRELSQEFEKTLSTFEILK